MINLIIALNGFHYNQLIEFVPKIPTNRLAGLKIGEQQVVKKSSVGKGKIRIGLVINLKSSSKWIWIQTCNTKREIDNSVEISKSGIVAEPTFCARLWKNSQIGIK